MRILKSLQFGAKSFSEGSLSLVTRWKGTFQFLRYIWMNVFDFGCNAKNGKP